MVGCLSAVTHLFELNNAFVWYSFLSEEGLSTWRE